MGAKVVVVHGETIVEPVPEGTNAMAIAGGCDILAHPGLITAKEARQAARRGVTLEISARKGHCLTNGHVVAAAAGRGGEPDGQQRRPQPGRPDRAGNRRAGRPRRRARRNGRSPGMFREAERLAIRLAART